MMLKKLCFACAISASLCFGASAAHAQTNAKWNTNAIGDWTDGSKWNISPTYPNNSGGSTYNALIDSLQARVNLDADIVLDKLTLASGSGSLQGDHVLTVNTFDWLGGTLSGSGMVDVLDSMLIDGSGQHALAGFLINIGPNATATWTASHITSSLGEGGIFSNQGTFNDQTDREWFWGSTATPVFNNFGTYLKSAGDDNSFKRLWPQFNNMGVVEVLTSGLWFAGGGEHEGLFSVTGTARLVFSDFHDDFSGAGSGSTLFLESSVIGSSGTVIFSNFDGSPLTEFRGSYDSTYTVVDAGPGGLVVFTPTALIGLNQTGDLEVRSGTVQFDTAMTFGTAFDQGTLTANGTLGSGQISGSESLRFKTFAWTSGTMRGDGSNATSISASLSISGIGDKTLIHRTLNTALNTTIGGTGEMHLYGGTIVTGGGTVDLQGDIQFRNIDPAGSVSRYFNNGTLSKSAGTGSGNFDHVEIHNTGTIIAGSGVLRLGGGGSHFGRLSIASGATLELASGQYGLTSSPHLFHAGSSIVGAAGSTLNLAGQSTFAAGSAVNVDRVQIGPAGLVQYDGGTFSTGTLELLGGGDMLLSPGADKTLSSTAIITDAPGGSRLDLADNRAIIDYAAIDPSPADSIRQQIQTAYNAGDWMGNGITTSTGTDQLGLGYADNSVLGLASFGGQSIDPSSVLIQLTYFGDANLDGMVDIRDLAALAESWESAAAIWSNADFNYDGLVDRSDLGLLARNWQAGVSAPISPPLDEALVALGLPPVTVPEPASALALITTTAFLCRRRHVTRR